MGSRSRRRGLLVALAAVALSGCAVYVPGAPPPRRGRAWVPGHYNRYGRWVPGHYR